MDRLFCVLEKTMNKSSIVRFKNFVRKYSNVTKWIICSDYCFDDKNKSNNVVSFVIYPYILEFAEWKKVIESMQKTDLKHCRKISPEFCKFTKAGYFFCFSFILEKNCILDKWKDKASMDELLVEYIKMTELWQQTTPNNEKIYKNMNKRLKGLKNQTKSKSFNYKLLGRIVGVSFLASYLKYLLYREVSDIEIFSWLSDRDAITNWQDEIYLDIYHVMSHCLIANKLSQEEANKAKEISLQNVGQEMFYDALNRVADFFCGAIADFNYIDGRVTKDKQVTLMEEVISDNEFLIILNISEKGVACIRHEKMN